MSKAVWEALYGLLPAQPTLILDQQSATPCSLKPRRTGAAPDEMFADRMEATIEAHAPGFRDLILARRVRTPPDLEAANANVVGVTSTAARSPSTSSCCSARGWTGGAGALPSRAGTWPGRACHQAPGCMAPAATWPPARPWLTGTARVVGGRNNRATSRLAPPAEAS